MVQQGEAQNNDCLFVVVLLAVIIAPPPLKDASRYASKQIGAHMHTLIHNPQECIHATAGTRTHTHTNADTCIARLNKISSLASLIVLKSEL